MKKIALRFLSVSLAFLLAINTAAAGRWLRSCWDAPVDCCSPCMEVPVSTPACSSWAPTPCCEPMDCGVSMAANVVTESADCGCGETVVSSSPAMGPPTIASESMQAMPTPAMPPEQTEVYESAPPVVFGGDFRSDNPAPTETAAPSDDWDAGIEEPAEEMVAEELPPAPNDDRFGDDSPAEEPADDLFADEAPMEEPEAEEPADDLFGAEPADESDDLFGEPMDDPTDDQPADDLFGAEPMNEPAPAEESGDDLFGDAPAAEEVEEADDLFGSDEPAADDFGADDTSGDDLFGEPREEPAAEEPASDDLFGEESEESTFEDAADDLFGDPPAEEPADSAPADDLFGDEGFEEAMPADEAADDLFGDEGLDAPAAEEAPTEDTPAEESQEDAFDDLFGSFGAVLREPGGVESAMDRTWVDNTGRFSTVGRLIAIDADAVRLEKQSGALATVPLARLSQGDLEFVSRQSLAQHQVREAMIARGTRPAAGQPKQASNAAPLRTAQL